MNSDLMTSCFDKIKSFFGPPEDPNKNSRIESAKVTSNRLQALQRMRMNSPTTPDYKLEAEAPVPNERDNIDLDFGM